MRIEQLLHETAQRSPAKDALVVADRRLTFAQLARLSTRLAATLAAHGVRRGDRVIGMMDNCWEAVVAMFGVMAAGAVYCPVHPSVKPAKLAWVAGNCSPSAAILQDRIASASAEPLAKAASLKLSVITGDFDRSALPDCIRFEDAVSGAAPPVPPGHCGIDLDLAMLIYTSGSTGIPKGVMVTHQNADASSSSVISYLGCTAEDVVLNALPISFSYGLYQAVLAARVGATLVLEKSFRFPYAVLAKMQAEGATGLPIVPSMASAILQMKDLRPGSLPGLRYITNAGAALPPSHAQRLQALFPATRIYSMYGMTECHRGTWLPPEQLGSRPASVGFAIPNTEVYVVDEAGRKVGPDTVGELVIRGPHVMPGYWGNQAATDAALRPGPSPWEKVLHTGDLFRTDQEGYLYFVGRKDDVIKTGAQKVSPKEVESVIYALRSVLEVAVVGVPDAVLGNAVKAVIVVAPGADLKPRDVIVHCTKYLEDFMVPKTVEFREGLPRTDSGKISLRQRRPEMSEAQE